MPTRRTFLKGLCASAAVTGSTGFALSGLVNSSPALAYGNQRPKLPVPALNQGRLENGVRVYDLELRKGLSEFFPGRKTPTLGINADYLGSTLRLRDGENIRLNVKNNIGERTTIHWHGLHLPAIADGGPHQVIDPGQTWSPSFTVKQKAATYWYHPHLLHKTGLHAYLGMAGAIIVDDAEADALALPKTYGVDDIPVVLQDKRFDSYGRLQYVGSMHDRMNGMKGDVLLVNGAIAPQFTATTTKVRLRLLNGSNARIYTLGFADNRPFQIIASDGSLLPAPAVASKLVLAPAERAEIIVDVADLKGGRQIELRSFGYNAGKSSGMMGMGRMMAMMSDDQRPFPVLAITAAAKLKPSAPVPALLANLPQFNPKSASMTRQFSLEMVMGPMVMMGRIAHPLTINGRYMDKDRIDVRVKRGATEIWEISNPSFMAHPFHIHDIQFQILDRNGRQPTGYETGLKDTVLVHPNEKVRVITRFDDYADPDHPYMYHCHILEHEDWGMMGQFVVEA